jgi:hypothetical protein
VVDFRNKRAKRIYGDDDGETWFALDTGRQVVAIREQTTVRRRVGESVELADGTIEDRGESVEVRFVVSEDGVRVVSFAVHDPYGAGLSAARLRKVKVGAAIRLAFEDAAHPLTVDGGGMAPASGFFGVDQREMDRLVDGTRRRRGRPPSTDDGEYRRAADLYRQAKAAGQPTTKAVAAGLGSWVSEETARKRIMGARTRGYLPPAGGTTRPKL